MTLALTLHVVLEGEEFCDVKSKKTEHTEGRLLSAV